MTWHVAVALQRLLESGRLRARVTNDLAVVLERPPSAPATSEWLDKQTFADFLGCSKRSIETAMSEGMPYAVIFGRAKFRPFECEPWLEAHGYLRRVDGRCTVVVGSENGAAPAPTDPPPDTRSRPHVS